MSRKAVDGGRDEHGARTLGAGVFLLLAGVSVALLVISVPLGLAVLAGSVVAGVLAARKRTAVEGLTGGPVDASERLEGFIIDPLAPGDEEPLVFDLPHHEHQQWTAELPAHEPAPVVRPPNIFEPPQILEPRRSYTPRPAQEPVVRPTAEELLSAAEAEIAAGLDAELDAVLEPDFDTELDAELEAELGADFDTVDLADLPPLEDEFERDRRIANLRSAHAEAVEQLNVAIARWHQLVGDDADPHDPEPVIRAHDPQLVFDPRHIDASPTVRTVASYHRSTQARWRVLWASLGADEVPGAAEVDEVLSSMLADWDGAAAELAQLEAAEARAAARSVLARPLVMVEPSAWISDARLEQLLSSLPDETDVVVVERAG
jgi:hypothetical protein